MPCRGTGAQRGKSEGPLSLCTFPIHCPARQANAPADEGSRDDPEPILLIHGTSASLHAWDGGTDALKGQRRVIRMDLPGFGLTSPALYGNHRMERHTDFVYDLMGHLGVHRAMLVGNSLGVGIAWHNAVRQTKQVSCLVLVDATGYPQQSTSLPRGFRLAQIS